ncbi:uncharacterized protein LOC131619108 [Vicia villosa]|uniref:uncharacterized protein LOC131619108 n=1 Tax=Vicia villosa TaxID=3911 RepID=UPI00273C5BF2|nr:uncharacterized protein LOC131619108 [Vicia villosa]XP_058746239.1 uncharacterized protein LOC131619108 [Vicia villosa]
MLIRVVDLWVILEKNGQQPLEMVLQDGKFQVWNGSRLHINLVHPRVAEFKTSLGENALSNIPSPSQSLTQDLSIQSTNNFYTSFGEIKSICVISELGKVSEPPSLDGILGCALAAKLQTKISATNLSAGHGTKAIILGSSRVYCHFNINCYQHDHTIYISMLLFGWSEADNWLIKETMIHLLLGDSSCSDNEEGDMKLIQKITLRIGGVSTNWMFSCL